MLPEEGQPLLTGTPHVVNESPPPDISGGHPLMDTDHKSPVK